jgi:hypothetical protein
VAIGDRKLLGTSATVLDANGKLLQTIKISSLNQAINLGMYTNGLYYIKLTNKEVLRVLKQ